MMYVWDELSIGRRRCYMRELPTGTVTLLFTDIEGSTRLLQQLGAGYARLLETCRSLLRAAFLEFHGHEVDTQGDAFFMAFARATDAVSAAVTAQRTLFLHTWPDGVMVHVRMGLHTGEPQLVSEGYVGLDVHHAARIMSAGHGGQVLLSHTTRDLVESILPEGVSLLDLGTHRLKDLQQPVPLFQLAITGLPTEFPFLKTLDSSPNNLPIQPNAIIGREKEADAVRQLLLRQEVRLVTLTGPGGIGKTRLALQAAAELVEHFADGTWFVSLALISDPELVIPTIIQTLGLREAGEQAPLEHLKEALQKKQTLLLLDNFEQVIRAAAHVADLLTVCPQLKVLITSREGLRVRAEHEFSVPALALPDIHHLPDADMLSQYEAVALFIERAQAVKAAFQVTNANAPAVAEICARLDGLPLAIELAAARIKLFPPQALLARLTQRLPLLTRSARDVPARQQTLRQTIQWSYDLLTTEEQRLFRLLALFVGGCTLQAIEAVSGAVGDETSPVLDTVASLIDKNLVQQSMQESADIRLTMLETIREFGLQMLERSGEMETARKAHADYFLALVRETAPSVTEGSQQAERLKRLEQERDNMRALMEWSLEPAHTGPSLEVAFQLVEALGYFWINLGYFGEDRALLELALTRREDVRASVRVKALRAAAELTEIQGDVDRAETLWQEGLALCRELGDTQGIAKALWELWWIAVRKTYDITAGRSLFEESLALYREMGDQESIAWMLQNMANFVSQHGDYSTGSALFEESLAMFREQGHKRGIAYCLSDSARWLFFARGNQAVVHARLEQSLAISREIGHKNAVAHSSWVAGWVALSQDDADTARMLVEQSLAFWQESGYRSYACWAFALLGRIEAHRGDVVAARAFHEKSLAGARELNDSWLLALGLEGLASVVAEKDERVWAARLWGAAESLRERIDIPQAPLERVYYEPAVAAARILLGEQAFSAAWAEGRAMTLEQVLADLVV
jgi:predicted ATPase/class 3 adenylate cyclase